MKKIRGGDVFETFLFMKINYSMKSVRLFLAAVYLKNEYEF